MTSLPPGVAFVASRLSLVVLLALSAWSLATPAPAAAAPPPAMYWGAWMDSHLTGTQPPWDMSAVPVFEGQAGKGLSLLHFGSPFADSTGAIPYKFPATQLTAVRAHGSIPFISWASFASGNYSHPDFTLRAIIEGRQDAYIRDWATAAKAWGAPFYLRFNWEMNGRWFPWGERYGTNQPGEYVAAWRHVHDIFRQVGATNANWVWCPTADRWKTLQPLPSLYPGNAYVNWTCLDGYNYNTPWSSFSEVFGSTYDQIVHYIAPSKPMIIGETSSTETGGSKAQWITDMFATLPQRFPKVRGLIWFDKTESGSSAYSDYPINSSPSAQAAFAQGVAAGNYRDNRYATLAGPVVPLPK